MMWVNFAFACPEGDFRGLSAVSFQGNGCLATTRAALRDFPLATLVTTGQDGIAANHIPLILDPECR